VTAAQRGKGGGALSKPTIFSKTSHFNTTTSHDLSPPFYIDMIEGSLQASLFSAVGVSEVHCILNVTAIFQNELYASLI
jgi:hypothetical protein